MPRRSAEDCMSRAIDTLVCSEAVFGEAVTASQLTALPTRHFFRETFEWGSIPTLPVCTDAWVCAMLFLPPPHRKKEKKSRDRLSSSIVIKSSKLSPRA
ncbi:hypothetical protein EVAR_10744_1 [Eumeta japonica]|uniref:Uncharacterized protein n=1 Tax=Eumeta variegata TaxID=151549 RepID=A0A4C1W5Y7_EUMVA|nr:hypothetical protein EVAR_10744_1 [Eumeta japonica]